jgi:DNA-binding winged helix-turn-helix (wHTH) protein
MRSGFGWLEKRSPSNAASESDSSLSRTARLADRFGTFALDAPGARLFRGASRVPLSHSQLAILLQLVTHAAEVVSKDTLVSAAWSGTAVTDNSLDQAISRLRKTLGSRGDRTRYIETVPNGGYRFAAAITRTHWRDPEPPGDLPLAPYRALLEGEDDLETFDRDAVVRARRRFEEALRAEPGYPPAHIGLANAYGYAFESTRADIAPDLVALQRALDHAANGCQLAPRSAEAWSTRAFVLFLSGDTDAAEAAAWKAVSLDGSNWRHAMRLSYVSWGEARLRAARRVLTLCPGLALAHYLMATVYVARQAFAAALEPLEEGCAAQDAQAKNSGYPAVGLHLHRARVLAAMGDLDAAINELTRELDAPHGAHVYGRECVANTYYTLGALRQRQGCRDAATAAFAEAVNVIPGHPVACAALGRDAGPGRRYQDPHTIDLAMARGVGLARAGMHREAAHACSDALTQAPAGCAGWLLATDPILNPTARPDIWGPALALLRNRAT